MMYIRQQEMLPDGRSFVDSVGVKRSEHDFELFRTHEDGSRVCLLNLYLSMPRLSIDPVQISRFRSESARRIPHREDRILH